MRRPLILLVGLVVLVGVLLLGLRLVQDAARGPDPQTIATASLQSMQEQARLTPFSARFVAVVTSRQSRFLFSTEKTLIMPGTVRYEVDLAKLRQQDVRWDEGTRTLSVALPPIEVSQPQVDLNEIKEYGDGGLLGRVGDTEDRLDAANRSRGQQELMRQAQAPTPMRLARDAARRAVERSFAMPLKAAGIDAAVAVRFVDEPRENDPSELDRSRAVEDVLKERQAQRAQPVGTGQ